MLKHTSKPKPLFFSIQCLLTILVVIAPVLQKKAGLCAQIAYQNISNKNISLGSYGRVGTVLMLP